MSSSRMTGLRWVQMSISKLASIAQGGVDWGKVDQCIDVQLIQEAIWDKCFISNKENRLQRENLFVFFLK